MADEWLNRISIFTKDGDWIGKWGTKGDGDGDGDGELGGPSGMAFDSDNNLLVVDSQNNRVQKFTKDGKFIAKWGQERSGDGQLNLPWGIPINSDGNVFIADWQNDRIQKFTADGKFLMKIGTSGKGEGQMNRPTSVGVDQDGLVYVADWGDDRLQVFDGDGNFVALLTGDATISKRGKDKLDANDEMWKERAIAQGIEQEKDFWGALGVEVDDQGRIFVVESARNRIQVYRKQAPMFSGGRL